jgi:hypothetical protein
MRVLTIFALLLLGCAVEVESEPITSEEAPSTDVPAFDARVPATKGGSTCAPVLNANLELEGWLCAPPRWIDPGDDFGDPTKEWLDPGDLLTAPESTPSDR